MNNTVNNGTMNFAEYQRAAEQGDVAAQYYLASYFLEIMDKCPEAQVPGTEAECLKWIRAAAENGHAEAQWNYGVMYQEGIMVEKNIALAAQWYQKSAAQGFANAQNILGVMYLRGEGVPQDKAKAIELFQKAAAQGHEAARDNLNSATKKKRNILVSILLGVFKVIWAIIKGIFKICTKAVTG